MTRQRGECIVLFGHHPPHDALYAATETLQDSASDDTWTGQHLSEEQLQQTVSKLGEVVDQIGGMVSNSLDSAGTFAHFFIRSLSCSSTPPERLV